MEKIENLTFDEYLKYFDVGVKDYVIAEVHDMSYSTLKNRKIEWGFNSDESNQRKVDLYWKWRDRGFPDKEIAKLMGIAYTSLHNFKVKNGLTDKLGWNAKGKGARGYGNNKLYG